MRTAKTADATTDSSNEPPEGGKGGEGGVFPITNAELKGAHRE